MVCQCPYRAPNVTGANCGKCGPLNLRNRLSYYRVSPSCGPVVAVIRLGVIRLGVIRPAVEDCLNSRSRGQRTSLPGEGRRAGRDRSLSGHRTTPRPAA